MNASRKVLFVAYNFPPDGGPGVQRSLKFVKYLPHFAWRPLVITTEGTGDVQDLSLLQDVPPETFIRRFPALSIPRLHQSAGKYGFGKAVVLANVMLQLPDAARFWAYSIRREVLKIIAREKPDAIYTTSGPYSAHLLGRWLRDQTGLPWLADFRDPWSRSLLAPYPPGYRRYNRWLERRVLAAADRVTCVSQPWLDDLQRNLGRDDEKFGVLPNGYDEDVIIPPAKHPSHGRFTIVHYGTFYRNRRPDHVVASIRDLVRSGRIPVDQLRVVFVGRNTRGSVPDEPPFEQIDYVPFTDLQTYRTAADVLLLMLDPSPENVGKHSGKLFEYIASNRPILGIVPPGGVAEQLIRDTRTGMTVDGDPRTISDTIETLYLDWKDRTAVWNPDWTVIRQYTRKRITQQLAEEFDRMTEGGPVMS